jgi:serine/threonine-protein kinase
MRCFRCDNELPKDARFCSICGLDVDATTPMNALGEAAPGPSADLAVVRAALAGEFDVKEEIGRGGMATVFRAHETALGREVAIKVLPFSQVHDASLVERFQNEARTAARLEHPHIIPIYRVGRVADVIFFSMRYVRGPSLSELLAVLGSMEPQEIRRILIECARALGYAHAHGVVHRDIKPDNIMFKESGEILVCDFGIARAATSNRLTGTGTALGTPYYMSPEQLRAQPLDGRSDLYSLGVVGFQCIANKLPFDGEDAFAIGYKHITEEVPTPLARCSASSRS